MRRTITRRRAALAAVLVAGVLCVSCSKAEPVEIPVPEGIDLEAASEVGTSGNGLWILDGVTAAGRVLDAMHSSGGGTMTATVQEMLPVKDAPPKTGRSMSVTSVSDGSGIQASFAIGDQVGELIVIGQQVWVRGNPAFVERIGVNADTEFFACMARGPAAITELMTLAEPADFLRSTLSGLEIGALSPTEAAPEMQTLVLGTSGAPIGELSVAAVGAPLPEHLVVSDASGSVDATFTWGDVAEIRVPEDVATECE